MRAALRIAMLSMLLALGFAAAPPALGEEPDVSTLIASADGFANLRPEPGCSAGQMIGCAPIAELPDGEPVIMQCWTDQGSAGPYGPDSSPRWFSVYVPRLGLTGFVWSGLTDPATQTDTPNCYADGYRDPSPDDPVEDEAASGVESVELYQGPYAPDGYRYEVHVRAVPGSVVTVECFDTVDSEVPFYTFDLAVGADGYGATTSQCYSADGPDHWVSVNGVWSNTVTW